MKVKPDDHTAWSNRGGALGLLGRFEEAIASFDQALKVKPDFHLAWINRGGAAKASLGSNRLTAQAFLNHFIFEVGSFHETLLSGLKEIGSASGVANCCTTWDDSKQFLLSYFADSAQLCAHIQQPPPAALESFIQEPPPDALIEFVQTPLSSQVFQQLSQDVLLHPAHLHPETLNERGYQGALNSYWVELGETSQDEPKKAICKDTHPEGWGELHKAIAQTHYDEGCRQPSPAYYWGQAESHFKRALETLQPPAFEDLYLEVLKKLIQVLLDLGEYQEAQVLQQKGRDFIARWLQDPDRSEAEKQKLGLKLGQFAQLTVDLTIRAKDIPGALQQAEFAKNVCLRWLLGIGEAPEVSFPQMQPLLASGVAAIYWHLSPAAITTFLLLPGADAPILIPPVESNDSETDKRSPQLQQVLQWENWLSWWNQQYESYGSGKDKTDPAQNLTAWRRTHPWRTRLSDKLTELGQILNVEAIHQQLQAHTIENLILIPHRDLHRLPLHLFFEAYPCHYLPSAQVGLEQLSQRGESPLNRLLMVENPESTASVKHLSKKLAELPFAEVEAAWIRELFRQAQPNQTPEITTLERQSVSRDDLVAALKHLSQVFHFTGHGTYDNTKPSQSCLFLTGPDRLTLLDIVRDADLSSYQLVCLAACETAVSGNQTITDEYVGLTSAFLKAGAASVVSTLWRIESAASMVFVTQFYKAFLSGQSAAVALKTAQAFIKTAAYDQLLAVLEEGAQLIRQSRHPQAASLALALEDECDRLRADQQEASRMEAPECPYRDPYYWSAFTLSGL